MPKDKKDSQIEVAKYALIGTVITAVLGLIGVLLTPILENQSSVPSTTPTSTISGSELLLVIAVLFLILGLSASIIMNFYYYRASLLQNEDERIKLNRIENYLEMNINSRKIGDANNQNMDDASILLREFENQKETLLLEEIVPLLKSLLTKGAKHPEEIVNIFARLKLVELDSFIIKYLQQPNSDLQVACVNALGELKTKKSFTVLRNILKKPRGWDESVSGQSILAVRKMNSPDYFDLLIKLLLSDDVSERIKLNFVIPVLNEINPEKAETYVLAYQISKAKGERLEDVVRQLINTPKDRQ